MTAYLITCEHASAHIPMAYGHLFASKTARARLKTHEAYDIGAFQVAKALAKHLGAPLIAGEMSRLLVDLNRSEHHPQLSSLGSRSLETPETQKLLAYHRKYRATVKEAVSDSEGQVVHLSVHSFTPIWQERVRTTEIGLLYDPSRPGEKLWVDQTRKRLKTNTHFRIHRNAPYRGTSDGLTKNLRAVFSDRKYCGLEIEFNQHLLLDKKHQESVARAFCDCL